MHQVTISAPAPVSPPISKPAGFPGATSRPNDFSSALPLNLPSGFPGLPGLFPPVAMAAAAARQFVAQQQTAQPGLPSPVGSTAGFLSSPRNLTMGNNMGQANQTGNGNDLNLLKLAWKKPVKSLQVDLFNLLLGGPFYPCLWHLAKVSLRFWLPQGKQIQFGGDV